MEGVRYEDKEGGRGLARNSVQKMELEATVALLYMGK